MKYILTAYLTAALSVLAVADEVKLTNGRTLVGIVNETPSRVMVETRFGDITVPRQDVQSITPGRTPVHEHKERVEALGDSPSADELFALAQWTQQQGLIRYTGPLLNRAVAVDPDHRQARRLLGYVHHGGQWMTQTDRDAIVAAEERIKELAARKEPEPVRRRMPPPEETPYSLGLPMQPNRSMTEVYPARRGGYSNGGVTMSVGGVNTDGSIQVPVGRRTATR